MGHPGLLHSPVVLYLCSAITLHRAGFLTRTFLTSDIFRQARIGLGGDSLGGVGASAGVEGPRDVGDGLRYGWDPSRDGFFRPLLVGGRVWPGRRRRLPSCQIGLRGARGGPSRLVLRRGFFRVGVLLSNWGVGCPTPRHVTCRMRYVWYVCMYVCVCVCVGVCVRVCVCVCVCVFVCLFV